MRKLIISKENIENIIQQYQQGKTISQISNLFNINRSKIREILKDNQVYEEKGNYGIRYNWTEKDVDDIRQLYLEKKLSTNEIGTLYGCYGTTISNILNQNGISTERRRETHNFTKYVVNEVYFEVIDTENKAYWLGFLLADGHISKDGKIILALKSSDAYHIERFLEDIDSNHPISERKELNSHQVTIGSKIMATSLREKGFHNTKSWGYDVDKVTSCIPDNLIHHFIRGIFDGDGSVGIYQQTHYKDKPMYNVSIAGIIDILKYIQKESHVKGSIRYDKRTINNYALYIRSKNEIMNFRDFIYKDANIFMNRKHDIFVKIK